MNKIIKSIVILLLTIFLFGCTLVENNTTMAYQEKHTYLLQEIQKTKTIELYKKISGEKTLIETVTDENKINDILTVISETNLVEEYDAIGSYFFFYFYDENKNLLVEFNLYDLQKDSIKVLIPIEQSKLAPFFDSLKNEQLFAH